MSESVSKAVKLLGGPEAEETAHFLLMFDRLFDCLNVGNFSDGHKSLKPFQLPYRSADDFRLKVFMITYLSYFMLSYFYSGYKMIF